MRFSVIPKPCVTQPGSGAFQMRAAEAVRLRCPGVGTGLRRIGQYLTESLLARGMSALPILPDLQGGPLREGSIYLVIEPGAEGIDDEGYELTIDSGSVCITASTEAGVFYGVQTLLQLAAGPGGRVLAGPIEGVVIKDQPRFPWRGFMLDSARHMQSVAEIKRIIDHLAGLKLNRFHWHIADDQGWRFEVRKYPRLTSVGAWRGEGQNKYGGFYTQREVREIVAYAKERYITVIPEIDMPGHCNAALLAYPELSCTGEPIEAVPEGGLDAYTRNGDRKLFCAGRDEVMTFLKDVLKEVAEVFEPPYIHLGGDERPTDIWSKCPRCNEQMKRRGVTGEDELELWFATEVATYVHNELKVGTIGWGDNLKKAGMPGDQIVQGWLEGQSEMAAGMGRKTINSFHEWVYLDYPMCEKSQVGKPDWMPLLPAEKVYGFEPVPKGLDADKIDLVLGGEAPVWTEYVETFGKLVRQVMPRLAAFSEVMWSTRESRDYGDFKRRADQLFRKRQVGALVAEPVTKSLQIGKKTLDRAGRVELNR